MNDLTSTIQAKSDQLNADDLMGGPVTVKVTKVTMLGGDQPVAISYEGDNGKPWKPCKSMRRLLIAIWGGDGNQYVGRFMTIYRDPSVKWAGKEVGGVRISHMSGMKGPKTVALTATRGKKNPHTVKPLEAPEPAPAAQPDISLDDEIPFDDEGVDLIAQGDAAAQKGVAEYTAWIGGLTREEKAPLREKHSAWSDIAKNVDKQNEGE